MHREACINLEQERQLVTEGRTEKTVGERIAVAKKTIAPIQNEKHIRPTIRFPIQYITSNSPVIHPSYHLMAGINRRHKNPIHDATTSRTTDITKLRGSIRSLHKQAFAPRISRARGGTRRVMGRLIGGLASSGEGGRSGMRGEESVANESGDHARQTFSAVHQDLTTVSPTATPEPLPKITGRLTIEDLLSEGNLAGLPEKYRHARNDEREQYGSAGLEQDGEEDMDIVDDEEDAESNASDDPLLLYPTRGQRMQTEESTIQEDHSHLARTRQPSTIISTNSILREVPPAAIDKFPHTQQIQPSRHPPAGPILSHVSSESAWQEPGTLSSLAEDYDTDFNAERDRFSDDGDDEMLDSAGDGDIVNGEERAEGYVVEYHHSGNYTNALENTTQIVDPDVKTQPQQPTRLPRPEEVSRFFNKSSRNESYPTTHGARLPPFAETLANDSAIGSWPASTVASTTHEFEKNVCLDPAACCGVTVAMEAVPSQGSGRQHVLGNGSDVDSNVRGHETAGKSAMSDGLPVGASLQHRNGNPQVCAKGNTSDTRKAIDSLRNGKGIDDLLDSISMPAQRSLFEKPRRIQLTDSPHGPTQLASSPSFEICDPVQRASPNSATQQGGGFSPGWSITACDHSGGVDSDDEPVYKPWVCAGVHSKYEEDEESFKSAPLLEVDIEREAFEEILENENEVDSDSDDEIEDGEASEGEAVFQHRLSVNMGRPQTQQFRPTSLWPRPSIIDQQAAMMQWYEDSKGEPTFERRRSARLSTMNAPPWPGHHIGESDRYAAMMNQHRKDDSWLYERVPAEPGVWEVFEEFDTGLELLGEDGLPYVFEPVLAEAEENESTLNQRQSMGSAAAGSISVVLFDASENPFLEQNLVQVVSDETPAPPTLDEVVVTYNYFPGGRVAEGEASREVGVYKSTGFAEEEVLRDVADYLDDLSRALAKALAGSRDTV